MFRFGASIVRLAAVVGLSGCMYGFAGGGLPPNVHTMAILPLENETPSPDVSKELYEEMRRELQRRLGVRDAPEARADAVVRGKVVTYDADVPVGFSADPRQAVSARRRLAITIDIEIVDQTNGHTLFQAKSQRAEGDYNERAEAEGRKQAIQKLISDIVDGIRRQW
jgi:hypothetical protein